MSLQKILQQIGFGLKPDFIVGCRYRFGTTHNGESLNVEGIVMHFLHASNGSIQYEISAPKDLKIEVIGLIKVGEAWLLQVQGDQSFVIGLEGNFTLV